jgi:hypothetical protein
MSRIARATTTGVVTAIIAGIDVGSFAKKKTGRMNARFSF